MFLFVFHYIHMCLPYRVCRPPLLHNWSWITLDAVTQSWFTQGIFMCHRSKRERSLYICAFTCVRVCTPLYPLVEILEQESLREIFFPSIKFYCFRILIVSFHILQHAGLFFVCFLDVIHLFRNYKYEIFPTDVLLLLFVD